MVVAVWLKTGFKANLTEARMLKCREQKRIILFHWFCTMTGFLLLKSCYIDRFATLIISRDNLKKKFANNLRDCPCTANDMFGKPFCSFFRRLSLRPTLEELENRNILHSTYTFLECTQHCIPVRSAFFFFAVVF